MVLVAVIAVPIVVLLVAAMILVIFPSLFDST